MEIHKAAWLIRHEAEFAWPVEWGLGERDRVHASGGIKAEGQKPIAFFLRFDMDYPNIVGLSIGDSVVEWMATNFFASTEVAGIVLRHGDGAPIDQMLKEEASREIMTACFRPNRLVTLRSNPETYSRAMHLLAAAAGEDLRTVGAPRNPVDIARNAREEAPVREVCQLLKEAVKPHFYRYAAITGKDGTSKTLRNTLPQQWNGGDTSAHERLEAVEELIRMAETAVIPDTAFNDALRAFVEGIP